VRMRQVRGVWSVDVLHGSNLLVPNATYVPTQSRRQTRRRP